ncbi:hypothetical protein Golax_018558, partial [Gossypium laxum]|nr:hypothetical protein [Gossypium laxum]
SALSQCPRETVFAVIGLKEGGDFIEIEKGRDEMFGSVNTEEMRHWVQECDLIPLGEREEVKEVKVEETLRYSFRRQFTIQLTIGLWESFLPNIVTDNLRHDLGDSNMVSSPLIEGNSTKLRDSFESIVADVGMDFEIREGQLGKSGYMEGKSENAKKDNENDEFLPDGEGNKKLKFRNEEPVVSMLPDDERTTLEYHSTLFIIGPRPATRFMVYLGKRKPSRNKHSGKEKNEWKVNKIWFEAWWTFEASFEEEVRRIWGSTLGNILDKLSCVQVIPRSNNTFLYTSHS